jgi:WD40 repeat protein
MMIGLLSVLLPTVAAAEPAPVKHPLAINCLAFSTDGTLASGGEDGVVILWDVTAQQELAALKGDQGPVFALAFSADARTLATASRNGIVAVWDVPDHKQLDALKLYNGLTAILEMMRVDPNQ